MTFQLTKATMTQLCLGIFFILAACCAENAVQNTGTQKPAAQSETEEISPEHNTDKGVTTQAANPASTNCVEQGGTLELQDDDDGQFGVCVFTDGSRCEEWHLFRKQCTPGTCHEPNGVCKEQ